MGKVLEIIKGEDSCAELDCLRREIETFTKSILSQYLEKTKQYCNQHSLSYNNTKNFYDAVWGTIEINEGEVYIINSPILQRLRRIKHLGLADLLYSSANHSRLSHTIGVLQTASSMWAQVERELRKKEATIDEDIKQIVRLAALFHDCGHMFCSHASERYFQANVNSKQYERVEKIRGHFKKKLKIKPSLSEIISILIVNSQEVRVLLSVLDNGLERLSFNNNKHDSIIEKICCLIIGFPFSKKTIPYSQIISGQIDSDKLDYLRRDSHMTGVPVAVDMSRVFQKLRMVPTKQQYTMLSDSSESEEKVYKLGIAPAAINTVDQLIISRYMMFENIYFHQKVLTAEEMLRYALQKLDNSTKGLLDDFSIIMQLDDAVVVNGNFAASINEVNKEYEITDSDLFREACIILSKLSNRELFKRCISFTSENLSNIGQLGTSFYQNVFINRNQKAQNEFVKAVESEVIKIKHLLSGEYSYCENTDILLIITPEISSASLNSNIAIADKINKDRNMEFEADKWLKSRSTRKPQNYLTSYEEDRYLVYIAAEKVLFCSHGLLVNDTIIYDLADETEIGKLKQKLDKKGYFADAYTLLPDDEIKRYSLRIDALVEKWKTYERFDVERGERNPIDTKCLGSYIKQFYRFRDDFKDFDVFVRGCMDLLENVRIITRADILAALKSNLEKVQNTYQCPVSDMQICCLGTVQDSGSQISYQINDVNEVYKDYYKFPNFSVCKLEELHPNELKPIIVFIEDAFSSARQIISMFETYMGIPKERRETAEDHVKELSDDMKEKLKQSTLVFSFLFYNPLNKERFLEKLKSLGLQNVNLISYDNFPKGYFSSERENDVDGWKVARKYFEAAGKMLIMEKAFNNGERKDNWDDDRISKSYLGYNSAEQLIVFPWNTPTYTVTALWLGSKSNQWYPLFQRIDKQ